VREGDTAQAEEILRRYGLSGDRLRWFVADLQGSLRRRAAHPYRVDEDILTYTEEAIRDGDVDEAVWRAFLAAHFGRTSASTEVPGQLASTARLLCGFGKEPYWVWKKVLAEPECLRAWLAAHRVDLLMLSFGNHRKYESKEPELMWWVFESLLKLVKIHGGAPANLLQVVPGRADDTDPFDVLYRRFLMLARFGRTGSFDFIELLDRLELVKAEARSCYLRGSTGPRSGAKMLWPGRNLAELERLAVQLASELGVSPGVLEDTLCNWQKHFPG